MATSAPGPARRGAGHRGQTKMEGLLEDLQEAIADPRNSAWRHNSALPHPKPRGAHLHTRWFPGSYGKPAAR